VTGRVRKGAAAAALSAFVLLSWRCGSPARSTVPGAEPDTPSRAGDARAFAPIPLPDLSAMAPSVRRQLEEQHARLGSLASADAAARALAHGDMGRLLLAAQSLEAAERHFARAEDLAPGDHRWAYFRGHLARITGTTAQAIAHFERALASSPDDLTTMLRLGELYLSDGRTDRAAALFERARTAQPGSAAAWYGLGRAALARDDFAGAVTHLERVLALEPQAAAAHYPLSLAYRALGDTPQAERHLQRRREGTVPFPDPLLQSIASLLDSPEAFESRGVQALDAGDWTAAAAHFRAGLALAPAAPSLRHRLGTALFLQGDAAGARHEFEQVIAQSPGYGKAHYSLGVLLDAGGNREAARRAFSEAVRLDGGDLDARLRLASVLNRAGRAAEALAQYTQVLDQDPRIAGARYARAITLTHLKRDADARDVLMEGATRHADQPSFALGLARVLAASPDPRVRNGREARAVLDRLSDADRASDGGETAAMVLAELGFFEQAAAWQRRAIEHATRAGRPDVAAGMREHLRRYEQGLPCRTPWRSDELP